MAGGPAGHLDPLDVFCFRRFAGRDVLKLIRALCAVLLAATIPTTANAGELFGGLHIHDVKTPLDKSGIEDGVDVSIGYRGGRIFGTFLQPYVFGALNSAGQTNYAA